MGAGVVVRDVRASSERRPRGSVCRCRAGAAVRADIRRHGSHSSSLLNTPQFPLRRRLTGPHQVPFRWRQDRAPAFPRLPRFHRLPGLLATAAMDGSSTAAHLRPIEHVLGCLHW